MRPTQVKFQLFGTQNKAVKKGKITWTLFSSASFQSNRYLSTQTMHVLNVLVLLNTKPNADEVFHKGNENCLHARTHLLTSHKCGEEQTQVILLCRYH